VGAAEQVEHEHSGTSGGVTFKKFRNGFGAKYGGKKMKSIKAESDKEGQIYHFNWRQLG